MPTDLTLRAMNIVHRALIALTRGRLGWRLGTMPVLQLTTIGRRTGLARTTLLTSPLRLGEAYVVVGSRGGDDEDPAWVRNLRAEPRVGVGVGGAPAAPYRARVMSDAERDRFWPVVAAAYPNYAAYQRRTSRVIPLVVLEPERPGGGGSEG